MSRSALSRPSPKLRSAILAAFCVALLRPAHLEATTVLPMDAAQLSDQAELVFTGTALRQEVVLSSEGVPYTFVTFAVGDTLKGGTMTREIALRFSGGDLGGHGMDIEGMPAFQQGESYLLFVRGNGSLQCPVLGWWQGQYQFRHEAGSGREILVDAAGAPLQGVAEGHFRRGSRPEAGSGDGGMTVLSSEGVEVVTGPMRAKTEAATDARPVENPAADTVVAQLRSFIVGRRAEKSFQAGRIVESARIHDLPQHSAPSVRQR
jgi:hypothetical protein